MAAEIPPSPPLFFDDDDGFGDFKFAPSPAADAPPPIHHSAAAAAAEEEEDDDDDDDWGDFVTTTLESSNQSTPISDPIRTAPATAKSWEKPNGALPLSLFGVDEEEEAEVKEVKMESDNLSATTKDNGSASSGGLKDLISQLYMQAAPGTDSRSDLIGRSYDNSGELNSNSWRVDDSFSSSLAERNSRSDEDDWEFKNSSSTKDDESALSNGRIVAKGWGLDDSFSNSLAEKNSQTDQDGWELSISSSAKNDDSALTNGRIDAKGWSLNDYYSNSLAEKSSRIDEDDWEFKDSSTANKDDLALRNRRMDANWGLNDSFSSSLAEASSHIDEDDWEFKDSSATKNEDIALHSSAMDTKVWGFDDSFVLGSIAKPTSVSAEENRNVDDADWDLKDSGFKLHNEESNGLSKSNGLMDDDCWEFKNSSPVEVSVKPLDEDGWEFKGILLDMEICSEMEKGAPEIKERMEHILSLASLEEQRSYILAWSKIAQACAGELECGAKIWDKSLCANVSRQILYRGQSYFTALMEIYQVAEVLRASTKLCKHWMQANQPDIVNIFLDRCAQAWTTLGLENSLDMIAATVDLQSIDLMKVRLDKIRLVKNLDEQALLNQISRPKEPRCRLSLLTKELLQGETLVEWNGEHYFAKLANIWANLVSSSPPQLPYLKALTVLH